MQVPQRGVVEAQGIGALRVFKTVADRQHPSVLQLLPERFDERDSLQVGAKGPGGKDQVQRQEIGQGRHRSRGKNAPRRHPALDPAQQPRQTDRRDRYQKKRGMHLHLERPAKAVENGNQVHDSRIPVQRPQERDQRPGQADGAVLLARGIERVHVKRDQTDAHERHSRVADMRQIGQGTLHPVLGGAARVVRVRERVDEPREPGSDGKAAAGERLPRQHPLAECGNRSLVPHRQRQRQGENAGQDPVRRVAPDACGHSGAIRREPRGGRQSEHHQLEHRAIQQRLGIPDVQQQQVRRQQAAGGAPRAVEQPQREVRHPGEPRGRPRQHHPAGADVDDETVQLVREGAPECRPRVGGDQPQQQEHAEGAGDQVEGHHEIQRGERMAEQRVAGQRGGVIRRIQDPRLAVAEVGKPRILMKVEQRKLSAPQRTKIVDLVGQIVTPAIVLEEVVRPPQLNRQQHR